MKNKAIKVKKMTKGKYYRKKGWKVTQLTLQQRRAKGYRVRQRFNNQMTKEYWITEFEYKSKFV